jgi:hypothetical protein
MREVYRAFFDRLDLQILRPCTGGTCRIELTGYYRNDEAKLIVTTSQNSIGNAITEVLGVVVKRVPDAIGYERTEPALIEQLLEVRRRLIARDLGEGIATEYWPAG